MEKGEEVKNLKRKKNVKEFPRGKKMSFRENKISSLCREIKHGQIPILDPRLGPRANTKQILVFVFKNKYKY